MLIDRTPDDLTACHQEEENGKRKDHLQRMLSCHAPLFPSFSHLVQKRLDGPNAPMTAAASSASSAIETSAAEVPE